MEIPILKNLKKLWDLWDIRVFILLSLLLQVFLVFFSSLRQRSRSTFLLMLIWSVYLMADWVAAVAIGLITKTKTDPCHPDGRNEDVYAFWASFLLLHLGGPDSITSFALEDNELWLRHLFGLILQVVGAGYSFYLTLPKNELWLPTILVLVVGTIKYAERTMALYLASLDHFGATVLPQPYPGPDYEEAVAIYSQVRSVQVPEQTEIALTNVGKSKDPKFDFELRFESGEMKLLLVAYSLFENFRGLITGFLLSSKLRESSQKFFLHRSAKDGFRLIEFELSFMYQVLHTKVAVVRSRIGFIFRCISFCFLVGAFILFHFLVEKDRDFRKLEISLTYALLIGAMGLDMISGIKLVFSDWILISDSLRRWKKYIPSYVLKRRRWSGSVSQYNMIGYCLNGSWMWNYKLPDCVRDMVAKIKVLVFSSSDSKIEDLQDLIFNELQTKSSKANSLSDSMEACSQRGDWALLGFSSYIKLKWSVSEFQYAESLLLWHLATDICYHQKSVIESSSTEEDSTRKRISKQISDYMFYLLIMKPAMLAPVLGNWNIVFQDTFAEAKRYFMKYKISDHEKTCSQMFKVKTKFRPAAVKGTRSKSVFFDACILAQQLQHLDNKEEKWELMSSVWVEMLSYGAINCRPIVHAQQPSKGGELLTFTWFLMNHLGLGSQFNEQEQQAGTNVLAVK